MGNSNQSFFLDLMLELTVRCCKQLISIEKEKKSMNTLSINEAAKMAGVHYETIRRWHKAGLIDACRPKGTLRFRINREAFENFLRYGVFVEDSERLSHVR